jgi:glycosyltransferase involved in cell wall biosynthesis
MGLVSSLYTQWIQRRMVVDLVARHQIDIVHQPMPVSPRAPSLLFNVGVPVVIGPMNGGMKFPPAFRYFQGTFVGYFLKIARAWSSLANLLIPGKVRASVLLVANQRTRNALPARVCGNVVELVENGVDLSIWKPSRSKVSRPGSAARFIFIGRLVDWKAVDLLLEAFCAACGKADISLLIVGDGPMRGELEASARTMGVSDRVTFSGFLSQPECARELAECDGLVLPSLFECGGAVVLEAMAAGLPVIATDWGGPADYLDETCGILIGTSSREAFVSGFSNAMVRLAQYPDLRAGLGAAARVRVVQHFDWEKKIDRILQIYQAAILSRPRPAKVQGPAAISFRQED